MSLEYKPNHKDKVIESTIEKEEEYPEFMNKELVEKWGDEIPVFSENDPDAPEWKKTPEKKLDLTKDGLGVVYIKDESNRESNPTGTIKDRAAWELTTLYRDYARALYLKMKAGNLSEKDLNNLKIPRFSIISSGNQSTANAEAFKKYQLPPPKVIFGKDIDQEILKKHLSLRNDVYTTDLSQKLTPSDIKKLSNNENGVDITSTTAIEPTSVFYDWHVHEVFNGTPDEIYVPYGSGRLMENYLVWQTRSVRNNVEGKNDPRLKAPIAKVINTNILGGEPEEYPSDADKLHAKFKPFLLLKDEDIKSLVNFSFTGKDTGVHKFSEQQIREAYDVLVSNGIEAEVSAAGGMAVYMDRFKKGLISPDKKVVIVNTGKGLI